MGSGVSAVIQTQESYKEMEQEVEVTQLDDAIKREVYVCCEGLLDAHLKQEVCENNWKGYMTFFPTALGEVLFRQG